MKPKKDLQKFTDTEMKINSLLLLKQISASDLETLNKQEKEKLYEVFTEKLNNLKGEEMDSFCKQVEPILPESTKNQLWEKNHIRITWAISILIQEYGRMPVTAEIANKTELSRQTVHKHLKEYASHPQYLEQLEQFRFMTSKVLARVFDFAVNGDIGAAKLYLKMMGFSGHTPAGTLIQNQNNYIQINGMVISQETVKQLSPEQLLTIETILRSSVLGSQTQVIDG